MYPLVRAYENGESSKKSLCAEHSLKEATFWYWVRKYREENQSGFTELRSDWTRTNVTVRLGDGILHFSELPDVFYLRELMLG